MNEELYSSQRAFGQKKVIWTRNLLGQLNYQGLCFINIMPTIGRLLSLCMVLRFGYSPSSQTSVSILTAIALLCLSCRLFVLLRPFWPSCCCCSCPCWSPCCCCCCSWSCSCCFSNDCCVLRNGTMWRPVWSVRPGVVASMPSSKSIMSDDDSESEDFFKCWPSFGLGICMRVCVRVCVRMCFGFYVGTFFIFIFFFIIFYFGGMI